MKRRAILAAVFVTAVFTVFGIMSKAMGQSFQTGTNVNVPESKTIDGSFYAAGRTLDINGTINGDLFCAGQNITVNANVKGDIICAGQNLHISGTVDGDIRAAGQTISINAKVGHSVTAAGQSFTLESTGSVVNDLTASSGDLNVNGKVGRDTLLNGRDVNITSSIGRDVKANVDKLTLSSTATVGGNLNYTSNNDANIEEGAKVNGKVTRTSPSPSSRKYFAPVAVTFVWALYMFLSLLLLSVVLSLLFPRAFHATSQQGLSHPWRSLLVGFVALFAAPILFIALMLTVVGIPLALLFGLAWFMTLVLSGPFFAYFTGRLILRNSDLPVLIMLVGAAVVLVVYLIPILGLFAIFVAITMGTGMILVESFGRVPKPSHPLKVDYKK